MELKNIATTMIMGFVLIILVLTVISSAVPIVQDSGNKLNQSSRCNEVGCHWNVSGTNTTLCELSDGETAICGTVGWDVQGSGLLKLMPIILIFGGLAFLVFAGIKYFKRE